MIKKEKKNVWLAEEKEVHGRKKKETFWRRKRFGQWRRRRTRGKWIRLFGEEKEEIFGDGNYLVGGGKEEWRRKSRKISWRRKKFADRTKGRETSRAL